jgi:hypothetical protein
MGNDMSIKHIIARHELVDDVDHNIIVKACNDIHVKYKMQIKWEISGSKCKWRMFMKGFDSTTMKFVFVKV